jgi:hypothetical protein
MPYYEKFKHYTWGIGLYSYLIANAKWGVVRIDERSVMSCTSILDIFKRVRD